MEPDGVGLLNFNDAQATLALDAQQVAHAVPFSIGVFDTVASHGSSTDLERFAASGVQHYYDRTVYRPENLRSHGRVKKYYAPEASVSDGSGITPNPSASPSGPVV
jgi:hypothetical protein